MPAPGAPSATGGTLAAIDKLLQAAVRNKIDVLELEPGRTPVLRKGERTWAVSKSSLGAREILRLIKEVVKVREEFPPPLPQSTYEFDYDLEGLTFHFLARLTAHGWTASAVFKDPTAVDQESPGDRAAAILEGEVAEPIPDVDHLLQLISERRASDLHLTSGLAPRLRIDGDLSVMKEFLPPSDDELRRLLYEVLPDRNREELETVWDTDFGYEIPEVGRYRVNLFRDRQGIGGVFRTIPTRIPTAEDVDLTDEIRALSHLPKGLVLVTGPTGSGKSTTLAALVDLINRTRQDHLITIEDPIEFVHPSRKCLVHQREVGVHTQSFKRALRAALREDPDVVLVGEMRDLETIAIALETAETGHLVFGTLHTTTAISTIDRIIDQFPADHQPQVRLMLSDTLKAVIAQVLVKRIGGGRVAAREVLLVNAAVANLIREGKTFQVASIMQTARSRGMRLLNDSLMELVRNKVVDPKEAYLKSADKDEILKRLDSLGADTDFVEELKE